MDCKVRVKARQNSGKGANCKICVKRQRSFGKEDFYENEVKRQEKSGKAELCEDGVKRQQEAGKVAGADNLQREQLRQAPEGKKRTTRERMRAGNPRAARQDRQPAPDR